MASGLHSITAVLYLCVWQNVRSSKFNHTERKMADSKSIGIVVVGLGRAGKARVRDLEQRVLGESANLRGVISRRKVDDLTSLTWDEALASNDVDAFVISTENSTHEEYARKALEHGKHVLVDFPLCLSAQSGKELYDLAESKGLVCHVENIALLLPLHQHFKQTIKSKVVPLQEGIVRLDARFSNAWITDESLAGFPSFSGISDLECMVDLFGELTLKEARYVHETDLRLLTCEFSTSDDRLLTWITERRREGKPRHRFQEFKFEDGSVLTQSPTGPRPPTAPGHKGLFAKDLELFLAQIRGERSSDEIAKDKKLVLDCLKLAEEIEKVAKR